MIRIVFVAVLLAGAGVLTRPAAAALAICNESGVAQPVAIAYKQGEQWVSEGWWNIPDGLCRKVEDADLGQRYYYFRAGAPDAAFAGEGYFFCTSPQAFTIEGDADCEARGHLRSEFSVIDTGSSARHFVYTIPPGKQAEEVAQQAEPEAGALGEPFTMVGVFQGCDVEDGEYCAFHANGWKHYAYRFAGTPDEMLKELEFVGPGQSMKFEGDMITFGDITSEVALRSYEYVEDDPFAGLREDMQGYWYAANGSGSSMRIEGSELTEIYDANIAGFYYLQWAPDCEGSNGAGPVLIQTDPENRDDPLCLLISTATPDVLVLSPAGDHRQSVYTRGN